MEQQQDITSTPLIQALEKQLPKVNFFRFCYLLEQAAGGESGLGTRESPALDPLRFAPSPEMSFPASELKCIERESYLDRPTTVRTRFLGLYGVDSVLPPILLDDIVKKQDGYQTVTDFLDIFNHRIITQFYRVWKKYHYPASFVAGGTDATSQCLLGLTGLGIPGTSEQIATPASRFLALLGLSTQRTRTAEGIIGVIKVLVPNCEVKVNEFYPVWMSLSSPAKLGGQGVRLNGDAVLGKRFRESNQTVQVIIKPQDDSIIETLLPGGQLHQDMFTLMRAYLGYKVDAQVDLQVSRQLLPRSQLTSKGVRLGQTASLFQKITNGQNEKDVMVNLGRYRGIAA